LRLLATVKKLAVAVKRTGVTGETLESVQQMRQALLLTRIATKF